jgi:Dockerin type I domain
MNSSQSSTRRRCAVRLTPEVLESRELLTGSGGNTFAVLPGTITKVGGTAEVKFTIDPSHFTIPKKGLLLGIDVAPDPSGTLQPEITGVVGPTGAKVPGTTHGSYAANLPSGSSSAGKTTTAVLTTVKLNAANPTAPVTFTVDVKAKKGTSGAFLLGFYLPGDTTGAGTVTQTDVTDVVAAMGSIGGQTKYNFNADANRDGKISAVDLKDTLKNLGATTNILPTASANLDTTGMVDPTQQTTRNSTVTYTGNLTPGATITFTQSNNAVAPVSATADSAGNYVVTVPLAVGANTFNVATKDAFGQSITGALSTVTYLASPDPTTPALSTVPIPAGTTSPTTTTTTTPAATTTTTAAPMIPATTTTTPATTTATTATPATTATTSTTTTPAATTTTTTTPTTTTAAPMQTWTATTQT